MATDDKLIIDIILNSNYVEQEYSDKAFDLAIEAWQYLESVPTNVNSMIEAQRLMIKNNNRNNIVLGIRNNSVFIGNEKKANYGTILIRSMLDNWIKKTEQYDNAVDILSAHVEFENIHPFNDGNGRIGRMLMLKQCLKYKVKPIMIDVHNKYFYYKIFTGEKTIKNFLKKIDYF